MSILFCGDFWNSEIQGKIENICPDEMVNIVLLWSKFFKISNIWSISLKADVLSSSASTGPLLAWSKSDTSLA